LKKKGKGIAVTRLGGLRNSLPRVQERGRRNWMEVKQEGGQS